MREAERKRQFEEFKDRIGEIVNGLVKRVEFGNVTVDLGRAEAILRRDELLPRETFRTGDRVRAYIYDVREEPRGPQIFLSRTHPQFMAKLFAQEVPEIYDGIIEIKAVARDPGSRAKIAVISQRQLDRSGRRLRRHARQPRPGGGRRAAGREDRHHSLVARPGDLRRQRAGPGRSRQGRAGRGSAAHRSRGAGRPAVSLAIGRRGQNVRLASQLTGWDIDILTEAEESERRSEEFRTRSQMFIDALDVDDVIAHLLVTEGFTKVEEVAFVPIEELAAIEGFDEDVADELRERARPSSQEQNERARRQAPRSWASATRSPRSRALTPAMLVTLGEAGIKTLDDLADLPADELIDAATAPADASCGEAEANAMIMAARAHWFAMRRRADGRTKPAERRPDEAARGQRG